MNKKERLAHFMGHAIAGLCANSSVIENYEELVSIGSGDIGMIEPIVLAAAKIAKTAEHEYAHMLEGD